MKNQKDINILQNIYYGILFSEVFDPEMGANTTIKPEELVEYFNRVLRRARKEDTDSLSQKLDYHHKPYIHPSTIRKCLIQTPEGESIDLESFAKIITKRPSQLLRQNLKMEKSSNDEYVFFKTSIPALRGLVVDEDTGEFKIVTTCPSAGKCQLVCYAKHGFFVVQSESSVYQNQVLNFIFNDTENYKKTLIAEIEEKIKKNPQKKVVIRWNEAGDILSLKYYQIILEIVKKTPRAYHYIYTKEVQLIKSKDYQKDNLLVRFSYGSKRNQELFINKDDHVSHIVDTRQKIGDPLLATLKKYKYIERDPKKQKWVYNNAKITKEIIAHKYGVDPKTILTVDEINKTPMGYRNQYNVIVLPGESDTPAIRKDVRMVFLIIH